MRKGLLLILCGPAGVGKGTLATRLMKNDPGFTFSVSATTRAPRPGEVDGVHYYFLSDEMFTAWEDNGDFLETATVHGNRYGTPLKPVMQMLDEGRDYLLEIDCQGADSIMGKIADCVTVFLLPPSFAELERRLRFRATECEAEIVRRLQNARGEIEKMAQYRYVIVNDDVESAYRKIEAIIVAERLNTIRNLPEID